MDSDAVPASGTARRDRTRSPTGSFSTNPAKPALTGDPPEEEGDAHDQWPGESCEHDGYLLSLFLGNITAVDTVLHCSHILEDYEKEFSNNMKLLCEAGAATGTPVMF